MKSAQAHRLVAACAQKQYCADSLCVFKTSKARKRHGRKNRKFGNDQSSSERFLTLGRAGEGVCDLHELVASFPRLTQSAKG